MDRKEVIKFSFGTLEQADREQLYVALEEAEKDIQYFREKMVLTDEMLNEPITV